MFVNLHTHTEYSLLDGMCRISDLVAQARALGQPAIAMTDHGVLHGMVDFYKECTKDKDKNGSFINPIKPIIGCEVYVTEDRLVKDADSSAYHLVLLAKNSIGLENLIKIVSNASVEGFYKKPKTDNDFLKNHGEGIICLTACRIGEIPVLLQKGRRGDAIDLLRFYRDIFDEVYLEIQASNVAEQYEMNNNIVSLHRETKIPLVVTNDSHYIDIADAEDHDILLAIQTGKIIDDPNRMRLDGKCYWFKSEEETREMILGDPGTIITLEELNQAISNSVLIAEKCDVNLELGKTYYPDFSVPEGHTLISYIEEQATNKLMEYSEIKDIDLEVYFDRLKYELSVIDEAGLSGYLLIVQDFIQFCNMSGIAVGPGRGSAAGSLVVMLLGITKVDPIEHKLDFARFYVPGRKGRPDIDVDFNPFRRKEVFDYVANKYGYDRVSHIGTITKLGAKSTLRDVFRAFNIPLPESNLVCAAIPDTITDSETNEKKEVSLENALEESEELRKFESLYPAQFAVARKIEGLARNSGVHAAGIVVAPFPLYGKVPMMRNKSENPDGLDVTQLTMDDVEAVGFLKFDFLSVDSLAVITQTENLIGTKMDFSLLNLDDISVYKTIRSLDTLGMFQVCTNVARKMIKDVQPTKFRDLVDIIALGRPGPMKSGQDKEYVARKFGWKKVEYLHPSLEPILKDTYGVMLYQEQLMAITRELAGFSHMEADVVRKALGKKDKKLLPKLGEQFVSGCLANKTLPKDVAETLWADMARYGEYCFNLSHSVSYCMLTYWTAWLKLYYTCEFMAATLDTEYKGSGEDKAVKVLATLQDCKRLGIKVCPPDINLSQDFFSVSGKNQILFSLSAIKGVGSSAIPEIMAHRPYLSLEHMRENINKRHCNRKVLASLIMGGAFDFEDPNRIRLIQKLADVKKNKETGLMEVVPIDSVYVDRNITVDLPKHFTVGFRMDLEKIFLGGFISENPIDSISEDSWKQADYKQRITIAGIINRVQKTTVKKGKMTGREMCFVWLETSEGEIKIVLFPDTYDASCDMLGKGKIIRVSGSMEKDNQAIGNFVDVPSVGSLKDLICP